MSAPFRWKNLAGLNTPRPRLSLLTWTHREGRLVLSLELLYPQTPHGGLVAHADIDVVLAQDIQYNDRVREDTRGTLRVCDVCEQPCSHHVNSKCLFGPTRFTPIRLLIDGLPERRSW